MSDELTTTDRVYGYIQQFQEAKGYPPSFREICKGLGLPETSTSTISHHVKKLVQLGKLRKQERTSRALQIIEAPSKKTVEPDTPEGLRRQYADLTDNYATQSEELTALKAAAQPFLDFYRDLLVGKADSEMLTIRRVNHRECIITAGNVRALVRAIKD